MSVEHYIYNYIYLAPGIIAGRLSVDPWLAILGIAIGIWLRPWWLVALAGTTAGALWGIVPYFIADAESLVWPMAVWAYFNALPVLVTALLSHGVARVIRSRRTSQKAPEIDAELTRVRAEVAARESAGAAVTSGLAAEAAAPKTQTVDTANDHAPNSESSPADQVSARTERAGLDAANASSHGVSPRQSRVNFRLPGWLNRSLSGICLGPRSPTGREERANAARAIFLGLGLVFVFTFTASDAGHALSRDVARFFRDLCWSSDVFCPAKALGREFVRYGFPIIMGGLLSLWGGYRWMTAPE
jgi:hypothetical protein